MKKLLLLLLAMPLIFSSCSKDDDKSGDIALEGSIWELIEPDDESITTYTYTFTSKNQCKLRFSFKSTNSAIEIPSFNTDIYYSYIYNHPNIEFKGLDNDPDNKFKGTISGNKLTLKDYDTGEPYSILTKK